MDDLASGGAEVRELDSRQGEPRAAGRPGPVGTRAPLTIVRWILVPFAAWLAWVVAVFAGFELEAFATYLCPKEQLVSDMCTADWYGVALTSIYCIGAAMAAALVVLLCTLIAPARRDRFARVAYFVGTVVAIAMGIETKMFLPLACALVAGALVWRWFDRRSLWPLVF